MSGQQISLSELRAYLGPHPEAFEFSLPGATVLALVEAVEAAHVVIDEGWLPIHQEWSNAEKKLAAFDFGEGSG